MCACVWQKVSGGRILTHEIQRHRQKRQLQSPNARGRMKVGDRLKRYGKESLTPPAQFNTESQPLTQIDQTHQWLLVRLDLQLPASKLLDLSFRACTPSTEYNRNNCLRFGLIKLDDECKKVHAIVCVFKRLHNETFKVNISISKHLLLIC